VAVATSVVVGGNLVNDAGTRRSSRGSSGASRSPRRSRRRSPRPSRTQRTSRRRSLTSLQTAYGGPISLFRATHRGSWRGVVGEPSWRSGRWGRDRRPH